jgi:hypothetical protein
MYAEGNEHTIMGNDNAKEIRQLNVENEFEYPTPAFAMYVSTIVKENVMSLY